MRRQPPQQQTTKINKPQKIFNNLSSCCKTSPLAYIKWPLECWHFVDKMFTLPEWPLIAASLSSKTMRLSRKRVDRVGVGGSCVLYMLFSVCLSMFASSLAVMSQDFVSMASSGATLAYIDDVFESSTSNKQQNNKNMNFDPNPNLNPHHSQTVFAADKDPLQADFFRSSKLNHEHQSFFARQGQLLPPATRTQHLPQSQPQPQPPQRRQQPPPPLVQGQAARDQLQRISRQPQILTQQPNADMFLVAKQQKPTHLLGTSFTPNPNSNQRHHQPVPTLSAFDLTSLASLAPPTQHAPSQSQSQNLNVRRPPTRPLTSADGAPAHQRRDAPLATELPFVRQVFRPANGTPPQLQQPAPAFAPGNPRPTPPPLFVPRSQSPNIREVFFEPSSTSTTLRQPLAQPFSSLPVVNRRPSQRPRLVVAQQPQLQSHRHQDIATRIATSAIESAFADSFATNNLAADVSGDQLPEPKFKPITTSSTSTPISTTTTTTTSSTQATPPSDARHTPTPIRANIFTLADTEQPTSFSPALPINAALAASGGQRRRIPVRHPLVNVAGKLMRGSPSLSSSTGNDTSTTSTTQQPPLTHLTEATQTSQQQATTGVRRPALDEFYETVGVSTLTPNAVDGFGRLLIDTTSSLSASRATSSLAPPTPSTSTSHSIDEPFSSTQATTLQQDSFGSRLSASSGIAKFKPQQQQQPQPQPQPQPQQPGNEVIDASLTASDVDVKNEKGNLREKDVTYVTTMTYITTVLHGSHVLETTRESVIRSSEAVSGIAPLTLDRILKSQALIEPTRTLQLSSRVKGKATTIVNLKSVVNGYLDRDVVVDIGNEFTGNHTSNDLPQQALISGKQLELAKKQLITDITYMYTIYGAIDKSSRYPLMSKVKSERLESSVVGFEAEKALNSQILDEISSKQRLGLEVSVDFGGLLPLGSLSSNTRKFGATTNQLDGRVTEVNAKISSYVSFDNISAARVAQIALQTSTLASPLSKPLRNNNNIANGSQRVTPLLDTSFSLDVALSKLSDVDVNLNEAHILQADFTSKPTQPLPISQTQTQPQTQTQTSTQSAPQNQDDITRSPILRNSNKNSRTTIVSSRIVRPSVSLDSNAPSSGSTTSTLITRQRLPNKSRVIRPSSSVSLTSSNFNSSQIAAYDGTQAVGVAVGALGAAAAAGAALLATPTRTKSRLIVVTRTSNHWGVRQNALNAALNNNTSNLALLASTTADERLATSDTLQPIVSSTVQFNNKPTQLLRVSSKVLRSKFRLASSSRAPELATSPSPVASVATFSSATETPGLLTPTTEQSTSTSTQNSTDTTSTATPTTTTTTTTGPPNQTNSTTDYQEPSTVVPSDKLNNNFDIDSSAPVVVTYFTTTTHTLPYTLNSETLFTTIEETNSRIATELMADLNSHLVPRDVVDNIRVTPTTGLIQQTSDSLANSNSANEMQVAINSRTYFTTFTFFTTFSGPTITVTSSESTTSNVVVETMTLPVSSSVSSSIEPTSVSSPQLPFILMTSSATASSLDTGLGNEQQLVTQQQPLPLQTTSTQQLKPSTPETQTLVSTFTYYATVHNGSQTSLSPIVDVSTQLVTQLAPSFSLADTSTSPSSSFTAPLSSSSSSLLSLSAAEATPTLSVTSIEQPVSASTQQLSHDGLSVVSDQTLATNPLVRLTRTRSMYTTLTHFITFYSGTKTQLSTIQEISPTVVTEFVDKTAQLQQSTSDLQFSSTLVAVPSDDITTSQVLQPTAVVAAPTNQLASATSDATTTTTTTTPLPSSQSTTSSTTTTTTTTTTDQQQLKKTKTVIDVDLRDLISANSSQNVALSGNLGAAIKDIVQLLAGSNNGTRATLPSESLASLGAVAGASSTSAPTSASTQPQVEPFNDTNAALEPRKVVFVQNDATTDATYLGNSKQELDHPAINNSNKQQPKRRPDRVWAPGLRTQFVTNIVEPSLSYVVTTTTASLPSMSLPAGSTINNLDNNSQTQQVISTSFTSSVPPRTFVSTIVGSRTITNEITSPTSTNANANVEPTNVQHPNTQVKATSLPSSQQTNAAASHRLAVLQKTQAIKAQADAAERKRQAQLQQQQQQQQQQQLIVQQQKRLAALRNQQQTATIDANGIASISQCTPQCKSSANEVCKFYPTTQTTSSLNSADLTQGTFACACRAGHQLITSSTNANERSCQRVQSYLVALRLLQLGDSPAEFKRELSDKSSSQFKSLARIVREHVKRAYLSSDLIRDRFVTAEIAGFAKATPSSLAANTPLINTDPSNDATGDLHASDSTTSQQQQQHHQLPSTTGLVVSINVHLTQPTSPSTPTTAATNDQLIIDEATLRDELSKRLNLRQATALASAAVAASASSANSNSATASDMQSTTTNSNNADNSSAPKSEHHPTLFLADVEAVSDLDECSSAQLNDCHEAATCINEPGSYRCECRDYPDLNPAAPGTQCAQELKSCAYCNHRGDCLRVPSIFTASAYNTTSQQQPPFSTLCQCHRIYMGRRCEMNALLLATLLPIVAILSLVSLGLVVYMFRRWRKRSAMSKGFRSIGGTFGPNLISGTLDRKAMLESSSESSETHQRNAHHHHHAGRGHHHHHYHASSGIGVADGSTNVLAPQSSSSGQVNGTLYDTNNSAILSEPPSSSESSPRCNQLTGADQDSSPATSCQASQSAQQSPYSSSMPAPPQIFIPRARHNQLNYAVHRGQVYMW